MLKKGKWVVANQNPENIAMLQRELGISHLAAAVLSARGIDSAESARVFLCSDSINMHDPFLMQDMDKAVRVLSDAIEKKQKIAIYGDYDVDGITSTCILVKYLRGRGIDCSYYIPDRINEGYGLNICAIEALKEDGCELLITVDSGITAICEIARAKELGINVIVTDHHECKETLPDADAIINPRRCDSVYPFKDLAGVGVAFKLICAMEHNRPIDELLDEYSDMVALGTIADVMPVLGENRIIVTKGLKKLKCTNNIGLRALMQKLGLDCKPITANSVSFVLAPRINAAGRMGEADCTARLLLTDDVCEAQALADHLCELNTRRQEEENIIFREIAEEIQKKPEIVGGKIIVIWGENWHSGVIGIVSSRLAEKYNLPCVLISMSGDNGKGSGRSIKGFNLYCGLHENADLLERFGGHALAVGLSIKRADLEEFKARLEAYAEKYCFEEELEPSLEIDCEIELCDLQTETIKSLSVLEPFGMGNHTPLFLLEGATVEEITPISRERHVKLLLGKNGKSFYSFVFGMGVGSCPFICGDMVDIVFSAEINYYKGKESVQLVTKDICWGNQSEKDDGGCYNVYDDFNDGKEISKEGALCLCPCRDDLVAVFRHVKANQKKGVLCGNPQTLYRRIKYETKGCMNLGRFLICLDIFKEFSIFDYERIGDNVLITDLCYGGKVDINGSEIIKRLMCAIKG